MDTSGTDAVRVYLDRENSPEHFPRDRIYTGGTVDTTAMVTAVQVTAHAYSTNGSGNDTYIAVMCSIYDAKSGAKLWPNANTPAENVVEGSTFGDGLLKFPLSTSKFSAWQPGVHYIYNLVINANDEMGAIEFGNPTVDSFIEVISNYE